MEADTSMSSNSVFHFRYCFISPSLSLDNCNCYFFGLLDNDPRQYIILEIGRLSQTLIDLGANLYPYSNGWRLFIDASDYTLGHLLKVSMNLGYMKGYLNYVQVSNSYTYTIIFNVIGKYSIEIKLMVDTQRSLF